MPHPIVFSFLPVWLGPLSFKVAGVSTHPKAPRLQFGSAVKQQCLRHAAEKRRNGICKRVMRLTADFQLQILKLNTACVNNETSGFWSRPVYEASP